MDQVPLVNEMIEAGRRFVEEFDRIFPGTVAFWLKVRDERTWNLHVASPGIADSDQRKAFAEIVRITAQMKNACLDLMDVRLQKIDEPLVRLALDWQRRHPHLAMVADVPSYYGVEVERMYLYPPLKAAAA